MTRPRLLTGDVREVLKGLDPESVQCVVTSPPYWGLRDYGSEDQLGLEETPEEYVENMVSVFQEVKRVLRKDGTVWLNLGDSYAGSNSTKDAVIDKDSLSYKAGHFRGGVSKSVNSKVEGLKPKDLVGIPWRVAFALQADGWYLRSDIIWNKPNPMPESIKDRPTKSHEYIFLLTKSKKYYYDNDAIREPVQDSSIKRSMYGWDCDRPSTKNASMGGEGIHTEKMGSRFVDPNGRNKRTVWKMNTKPYKEAHFATFPEELPETCIKAGTKKGDVVLDPFAGSGTVCAVASRLGRNSIGIELNEEYLKLARKRCKVDSESLLKYV